MQLLLENEHNRIKRIEENNNFEIIAPLKKFTGREEILLYIYYLTKDKQINEFTLKELEKFTQYNNYKLKRWLKYLNKESFINIDRIGYRTARIYKLNSKGKEIIKKIIKKYKQYNKVGYYEFIKNFKIVN